MVFITPPPVCRLFNAAWRRQQVVTKILVGEWHRDPALPETDTKVADLCQELGITRQTLYRHVSPKGELRPDGAKLLT